MEYWTAMAGGALLAAVPLLHRAASGRSLAVSGRYTALVDRALDGPPEPDVEMSEDEMSAALEAMALEAFGADAAAAAALETEPVPADTHAVPVRAPRQPLAMHVLFLLAIGLGGALSAGLAGDGAAAFDLHGAGFHARYGAGMNPLAIAALVVGGSLVGFGTRMAGGCTSGHGLCGVSRFERGSLVATTGASAGLPGGLLHSSLWPWSSSLSGRSSPRVRPTVDQFQTPPPRYIASAAGRCILCPR